MFLMILLFSVFDCDVGFLSKLQTPAPLQCFRINSSANDHSHTVISQAMDVVDGRRAPFPPHHYCSSGDTRDTDTQAPSSAECSPLSCPCNYDHLHSPNGSPCSAEEVDKGVTLFDGCILNVQCNNVKIQSCYARNFANRL